MNADLEAVKMTENEAGTVQKRHKNIAEIEQNTENNSASIGEMPEKRRRNVGEMSEKNVGGKLTERQKIILKYIAQSNIISAKEISVLLQITDRTIEREMQKLKKMEILERIGGDRGGYWKIKQ
jgi:ATP-dependent DNA helicase RecG